MRRLYSAKSKNTRVSLLEAAGIPSYIVNPNPIGMGGNHLVYEFLDKSYVIKFPVNKGVGTVAGIEEERNNIFYYSHYFSKYSLKTTLYNPTDEGYFVIAEYAMGRRLTPHDISDSKIYQQLCDILEANQLLLHQTGRIIDLVGLEGFLPMLGTSVPFLGTNPPTLTNVLVDTEANLKIIDYDTIEYLHPRNPFEAVKGEFTYNLNAIALSKFYGVPYDG